MMVPVLTGTSADGKPLMKCPQCGAFSDAVQFHLDVGAGLAECGNFARHSRPVRAELREFALDFIPDPQKDVSRKKRQAR